MRPEPPRSLALAAITVLVFTPARAQAQSAPQAQPAQDRAAEAEALVQQGVAQRRAGQDQLALETFRRAFELAPTPRIRAQIALAEQALGQWVEADRDLRAALASSDDPWIRRNQSALEAALNAIANRIATIEVRCATPGARLWVNGRDVGALPLDPIRVEAGTVSLELRREGYRTVRRAIDVEGGRSYRESFTLVENPPEELASTPAPRTSPTGPTPLPTPVVQDPPPPPASLALLSAGAGLVALGVFGHIYWQNRVALYNSNVTLRPDGGFDEGCFLSTPQYPRRSDRCGAILTESWAGFGLAVSGYALGAAALGAGLILRLTHRPSPSTERAPTNSSTAAVRGGPATRARRVSDDPPSWTCAPTLGLTGGQCLLRF